MRFPGKEIVILTTGCMILMTGCSASDMKETKELSLQEYVTSDGDLTLNLPGDDWQIDEESEDLYIFSSSDGLVMFTHSENASDEMYPSSEGDIGMILDIEGYSSEGYEILEFRRLEAGAMKSFQSVIEYTESGAMYDRGILHGILIGEDVYMASAMLTNQDDTLLEAMKECVYGYVWESEDQLSNPVEAIVTPEPTSEATPEPTQEATPEPTPEPTPEATPEPTPEATPEPTRIVTPVPESEVTALSREGVCHSAAYVRNAPDNGSNVIGSVEEGEKVTITGEVRNWYRISYDGQTAYVCKDYIQ